MPIPAFDVVKSVLSVRNRGQIIHRSMTSAWATFLEDYPQRAWWRRKSTRAAVMWEHSVETAINDLDGDDGCKPIPHDDTVSFIFDQKVLVRFKKADFELKTSNVQTFMAQLFHSHEEDLFGFDGLHRVKAAYVLTQYQTSIDWIGIVARDKKRLLWQMELEPGSKVKVARLPLQERSGTAADRVMRPKADPNAKPEPDQKT